MMRIAVDTFAARPPWNCGGVYEYTRQLLRWFPRLAPEYDCDVTALVGVDSASLIDGLPDSASFRVKQCRGIDRPRYWRYGGCGIESRKCRADAVLLTNPDALPIAMPPFAVMIHDVPFLKSNEYSSFMNWRMRLLVQQIARKAHKILANSEYTKADIVRHMNLAEEKIVVTPLSYNRDLYNTAALEEPLRQAVAARWKLQRPYVLHCGTLQPRKNLVRLIQAYEQLQSPNSQFDFDLVLAGMKGFRHESIVEAAAGVAAGRVVITGAVREEELAALVKGAALCVIPSLYEGFCLPMLEAMACGVPTVVANNSCLPEISGGVLRYFNAESVEQIAETMRSVLQSPSEQQRLRQQGLKRAAEFSWQRCARQTLQYLSQVANGK
jgi:glycosyltransferase involved in cell wall biosynthesis